MLLHAGDPTLSQAVLRSLPAEAEHSSTGPPTPECGAGGRRVHWLPGGLGAPPDSPCCKNLRSHVWRGMGEGDREVWRMGRGESAQGKWQTTVPHISDP